MGAMKKQGHYEEASRDDGFRWVDQGRLQKRKN